MQEFINKWSNWWILSPNRNKLDDAFEKELNELIEKEVALRQKVVVKKGEQLVCPECENPYPHTHTDDSYSCEECGNEWVD